MSPRSYRAYRCVGWVTAAVVAFFVTVSRPSFADEFSSTARAIQVGHWLEVRGKLTPSGRLIASRVRIRDPQRYEALVGILGARRQADRFELLGQTVHVTEKTDWEGLDKDRAPGTRVKVEGYYRGPGRFSAREIAPRGAGRERIEGRVEDISFTRAGAEIQLMRYTVIIPEELAIEHDQRLSDVPLAPSRGIGTDVYGQDEDDLFGDGVALADSLRLSSRLEFRSTGESNFDLDRDDPEDRKDHEGSLRARLEWTPGEAVGFVTELRSGLRYRDDEEDGISRNRATVFGESFVFLSNPFNVGVDVQVGRQDFDEKREWLFDQNLDALRFIGSWNPVRLEVSVSKSLSNANERDLASTNTIVYVSNRSRKRHVASYVIHRDFGAAFRDRPLHAGARAVGEFLPDHKTWLDAAVLRGDAESGSYSGWALDVGTTYSPDYGDPYSFTVGYAFGSGDSDLGDSSIRTFRQTGFHDNNDKFGGVTSFRYYGELFDPELANLKIRTLGFGIRLAKKTSLDLVWHDYRQHVAAPRLVDSELDRRPDGAHPALGWELDAIFGWRTRLWSIEGVGAYFRPGRAFENKDDAFLMKFQFRLRL